MAKKVEKKDIRILIIIFAALIGAIGFIFYEYQPYHQVPLLKIFY